MQPKAQPAIRRRTNGTIDVNYYREAAILMRREAWVEMMRGIRPAMWGMAAALLRFLSFAVFAPHSAPTQVAIHSAPEAIVARQ